MSDAPLAKIDDREARLRETALGCVPVTLRGDVLSMIVGAVSHAAAQEITSIERAFEFEQARTRRRFIVLAVAVVVLLVGVLVTNLRLVG